MGVDLLPSLLPDFRITLHLGLFPDRNLVIAMTPDVSIWRETATVTIADGCGRIDVDSPLRRAFLRDCSLIY